MSNKKSTVVALPSRQKRASNEMAKPQANFARQARVVAAIENFLQARSRQHGRRYTIQEMADEMGLDNSQSLVSIRTGTRYLGDMNQTFIRNLAQTLGVSVVTLYQMAEFITPEDMYYEDDLASRADQAFRKMCDDPASQDVVPPLDVWNSWPQSARNHFAILYEFHALRMMNMFGLIEGADKAGAGSARRAPAKKPVAKKSAPKKAK